MRKADGLLLFSITLLSLYVVLSFLLPGMSGLTVYLYELVLNISLLLGYPGAFLVSFLGNATVLIPFPYILTSFILGGLTDGITHVFVFDPLLVGVLSGIGATLGEMTGYIVGYTGGNLIDETQRNGFRRYAEDHPRWTPFVLWFLAVTPIPDDVLVVPLGAAKYPWWKVIVPQLLGKTMFLTTIAYSGRLGLGFAESIIGSMDPTSIISRLIEVSALLFVIVAVYALVRADWRTLGQ
jgi:membrane protein YqaA with SNARE-associated domain